MVKSVMIEVPFDLEKSNRRAYAVSIVAEEIHEELRKKRKAINTLNPKKDKALIRQLEQEFEDFKKVCDQRFLKTLGRNL